MQNASTAPATVENHAAGLQARALRVEQAAGALDHVAARLACPACREPLNRSTDSFSCSSCSREFRIADGVVDMSLSNGEATHWQADAWADHWTPKRGFLEHMLSFYRMAICARIVRNAFSRYMPATGVFVEAGSGTAETSSLVDKNGGERILVAQDFVPGVLRMSHPVIDLGVSGDIFRMPFADSSLDGLWNVGVLEHYTHEEIDRVLLEFRRVLRPGGRLVIFWPATNSVPQKILVAGAALVGILTGRGAGHRFHPPEISQLHSNREGYEVLHRNGLRGVAVTGGIAGLIAFKTVVAEKVD